MNWTEMLKQEIDETYHATEGLIDLIGPDELDWRPATGDNWMSTGQLLKHISSACGWCARNFVEDKWAEEMGDGMGDATTMPAFENIEEAKAALAADKTLALEMVEKAGEEALANQPSAAPWNPVPTSLGRQVLCMVGHLAQHKSQLFYYLKLQGKPVNTMHLWGMAEPEQAT